MQQRSGEIQYRSSRKGWTALLCQHREHGLLTRARIIVLHDTLPLESQISDNSTGIQAGIAEILKETSILDNYLCTLNSMNLKASH